MSRLQRLLRPRSIAVLGGRWAHNVIEQLERMGFDGEIYPVHPTRSELAGHACLSSLDQLPRTPDATFLGVNRNATLECVQKLSDMGAGGAVCFASGWSENQDHELQDRLVRAAGSMPVLGPNCYGFINYLDGALLWPDQHGGQRVERGVAIICQSSNIAINLSMQARALPVACLICLGNAAQITLAQLIDELLSDERVTAIGIYLEGIADPVALAEAAEKVRASGMGIVALRSGRSAGGAAAAATHTAALSGDDAASRAFLSQAGIAEAATLDTLLETLKILHVHGPLRAHRFCAVTCSGGEAALMADLADGVLQLPAPSQEQCRELTRLLGHRVNVANPLDYQTDLWGDSEATFQVFRSMLQCYDAGLFVIDIPRADRCDPTSFEPALEAMQNVATALQRPLFPVASLPENLSESRAVRLLEAGIVPLFGLECAVRAVACAATPAGRAGWRPCSLNTGMSADVDSDLSVGMDVLDDPSRDTEIQARPGKKDRDDQTLSIRLLDEAEAKALLAQHGIAVPVFLAAATLPDLRLAMQESPTSLQPPLALKGMGLLHKSDNGAVRLDLQHIDEQTAMPEVSGYLVEEMVRDGVAEMLIGFRRIAPYGLIVTLGAGGTTAELLADTVTLISPVTASEIERGLRQLRLWPLFDGYRGSARADVTTAIDCILRLQQLMLSDRDILDIEINPLILRIDGAVAVDAIIHRRIS